MNSSDAAAVATLVLLEALLSADNALVLALIARRLPDKKAQGRALTIGVGLSFGLRAVGLLLASFVIKFWFLRAAGALYLLYLCAGHFLRRGTGHAAPKDGAASASFRSVVVALTLTDAAFAVDSILVAVALSEKLWVIYVGVGIGIVALRLVSGAFLRLLEKYPALDHAAYALVGWAGLRLLSEAAEAFGKSVYGAHWSVAMPDWMFWAGMGAIGLLGTLYALRRPQTDTHRVT